MMIGLGAQAASALSAALLALAVAPTGAAAHGFVSLQFGVPLAPGPPVYYYPPPPPPAYYYYYYPPPAPAAADAGQQQQQKTCREYQTTAVIDGKPQTAYGTACLQADGTWRITR